MEAVGLFGGPFWIVLNWRPTVFPRSLESAAPRSLQLVFFVEYTNQHKSLACSDWMVVAAHVAFLALSQASALADKVANSVVWPIYIMTAVLEGASGARPGK